MFETIHTPLIIGLQAKNMYCNSVTIECKHKLQEKHNYCWGTQKLCTKNNEITSYMSEWALRNALLHIRPYAKSGCVKEKYLQ